MLTYRRMRKNAISERWHTTITHRRCRRRNAPRRCSQPDGVRIPAYFRFEVSISYFAGGVNASPIACAALWRKAAAVAHPAAADDADSGSPVGYVVGVHQQCGKREGDTQYRLRGQG